MGVFKRMRFTTILLLLLLLTSSFISAYIAGNKRDGGEVGKEIPDPSVKRQNAPMLTVSGATLVRGGGGRG